MTELIDKTKQYVQDVLTEKLPGNCLYHNLTHTKRVFKSTKEIADNSDLNDKDQEILLLSALLHDIGYIDGCEGHEARSVEMARSFLGELGMDEADLQKVADNIMATRMEAQPGNKMESILRDADASHFGKEYFQEASEFLRLELRMQGIKDMNKRSWLQGNIELLENKHQYYTDYAKEHWDPVKRINIETMKKEAAALDQIKKDKKKQERQSAKLQDPDKAIQSVFRVTLRNHIKLSDIADTKANILLSVNAIIVSIALSNLIPKLDNPSNQYLIVPTIIFLFFTVVSIVLSVMATRPNVTSGKFTREDVEQKKVNLLFFGNFHHMNLDQYEWAMNEMLKDKEYIYSSLTKDLYFLGLVLNRKYKILRLTYSIFMIGIIVSVIAFSVAFSVWGDVN